MSKKENNKKYPNESVIKIDDTRKEAPYVEKLPKREQQKVDDLLKHINNLLKKSEENK